MALHSSLGVTPLGMAREEAVPSRLQQGCTLLLAAALVAAGVAGGQWFMNADYVVFGYSVGVGVKPKIDTSFACLSWLGARSTAVRRYSSKQRGIEAQQ